MIYSTLKLIILYLLSIALWGIDKFHSYLIDYGWWKPVALLYSLLLIIKFGAKIKNQIVRHIISMVAVMLPLIIIAFAVAYFMEYTDTFLGALPLRRLHHDDKFNIGILIGAYILLKAVGLMFIEDKNKK